MCVPSWADMHMCIWGIHMGCGWQVEPCNGLDPWAMPQEIACSSTLAQRTREHVHMLGADSRTAASNAFSLSGMSAATSVRYHTCMHACRKMCVFDAYCCPACLNLGKGHGLVCTAVNCRDHGSSPGARMHTRMYVCACAHAPCPAPLHRAQGARQSHHRAELRADVLTRKSFLLRRPSWSESAR